MATYAKLDENDIVIDVLVAEEDVILSGSAGDPNQYVQTSRNTMGGEHLMGKQPIRKNYAGIGYKYDRQNDAFIPTKVYDSWELNHHSYTWEPPIACPNEPNKIYKWDEENKSWLEFDAIDDA